MNPRLFFLAGLILATTTGAFAADPAAPPPAKKTEPASAATTTPSPATAAAAAPAKAPAKPAATVLDNYLNDLNDALKLSADEKKDIQTYYLADGLTLKNILNDDSLSPLQQAQQVADLRDKRNAKIDALLEDLVRRHDFYQVEALYRVALTEFAANGGMAPAQPIPAVPQPSGITPGQAEPNTGGL